MLEKLGELVYSRSTLKWCMLILKITSSGCDIYISSITVSGAMLEKKLVNWDHPWNCFYQLSTKELQEYLFTDRCQLWP